MSVFPKTDPIDKNNFDCQQLQHLTEQLENMVILSDISAGVQDNSHPYTAFLKKVAEYAYSHHAVLNQEHAKSTDEFPSVFSAPLLPFLYHVFTVAPTTPPFRLLSLPIEIIQLTFSFVPRPDLIRLCLICHMWHQLSTRYTHDHIQFALPPDWSKFRESRSAMSLIMTDYAVTSEVALVYLMSGLGLQTAVKEIELINWPVQKACFFFHTFPNVQVFRFAGTGDLSSGYVPSLPQCHSLPSTLRSVMLTQCCLFGNSIEELLGLQTQVTSLSLRRVDHGYISIPPEAESPPSETDLLHAAHWRMRHNLDDSNRHNMCHPPSLRTLCIDLSSVHRHPRCTVSRIGHALHDQLFASQATITNLMRIVPTGCIFPFATCCNNLEELDIVVGEQIWCIVPDLWLCVRNTLRCLSLDCPRERPDHVEKYLHLGLLRKLQTLKILVFVTNIRFALQTLRSWESRFCIDTESCLTLVVHMSAVQSGRLASFLWLTDIYSFLEPAPGDGSATFMRGSCKLVFTSSSSLSPADSAHVLFLAHSLNTDSRVADQVSIVIDVQT
ncbi:hypothetical protein IW261DRAFT_1569015 [Armillaria novae-zelandiae]|uniref:F-box domain-containing protein n=1 Tax=Armillaria novae-zelandiae TaxID=153914 RepID=A0AA39NZ10_9AGAR|nr:hypothetical protein IW261DRAFT_1569015 [Armillaria novae-zelandiae]